MPVDIPGSSASYPANVRAPVGGESRTAASVSNGLTDLANRTAYLKGVLDDGVQKIRTLDNIAALKALTGMSTNDVAFVPGKRLYRFNGASSVAGDDDWIVTPDSVGGRWEALEHGLRESTLGGLATITGLAVGDLVVVPGYGQYRYTAQSPSLARTYWRVAATVMGGLFEHISYGMIDPAGGYSGAATRLDPSVAPVPNRLVSIATGIVGSGSGSANATTGTNIASVSSVAVEDGDLVVISGQCAELVASTQDLTARILEGTTVIGTVAIVRAGERHPISFRLIRTIPGSGAGTLQYALNILSSSGSSTETHANIALNVEVVRP